MKKIKFLTFILWLLGIVPHGVKEKGKKNYDKHIDQQPPESERDCRTCKPESYLCQISLWNEGNKRGFRYKIFKSVCALYGVEIISTPPSTFKIQSLIQYICRYIFVLFYVGIYLLPQVTILPALFCTSSPSCQPSGIYVHSITYCINSKGSYIG